ATGSFDGASAARVTPRGVSTRGASKRGVAAAGGAWEAADAAGARARGGAPSSSSGRVTSSRRRRAAGSAGGPSPHLPGRQGAPSRLDFGNAFEQHLPRAREYSHRELLRGGATVRPLDLDKRAIIGHRRHDLYARDEMGEIGKIGQHHRGIGTCVVLRAQ